MLLSVLTPLALASCVGDPTSPACEPYVYPASQANADLDGLCTGTMATAFGCEVRVACADSSGHFCEPFSILADVCVGSMSGMSGCSNYTSMCGDGTRVHQCASTGPVPQIATGAPADAFAVCERMPVTGCATCTSDTVCPSALSVLHAACESMPSMLECAGLYTMCSAVVATSPGGVDGYGGLAPLCSGIVAPSASGSGGAALFCTGSTIMYMKGMDWDFANGVCITFVFKGWVLNTPAKYWFSLLLAFAIGAASQVLQCARGRFRKSMMLATRVTRARARRARRAIGRKLAAVAARRSGAGLHVAPDDDAAKITLTIEGDFIESTVTLCANPAHKLTSSPSHNIGLPWTTVEGMTCGGCETSVEGALIGVSD